MKILPSSGTEPGREGWAPGPSAAPRGRAERRSRELKKWYFPGERETPHAKDYRWELTFQGLPS